LCSFCCCYRCASDAPAHFRVSRSPLRALQTPSNSPTASFTPSQSVTPSHTPTSSQTPASGYPDSLRISVSANNYLNFVEAMVFSNTGQLLSSPYLGAVANETTTFPGTSPANGIDGEAAMR
jgi:hypothetical protein